MYKSLDPLNLPELQTGSTTAWPRAAHRVSRWLTRPAFRRVEQTPGMVGLEWEPLECRADDGIRLAGWGVSPKDVARATIVMGHDLRHNREQFLDCMTWLVPAGYRCVAFDHRAHGESEGLRTSFGTAETMDVDAVVRLVRRRWPGITFGLGIGMGAWSQGHAVMRRHLRGLIVAGGCSHPLDQWQANLHLLPQDLQRFVKQVIRTTERRLGYALSKAHWYGLGLPPTLRIDALLGPTVRRRVLEFLAQLT